MSIWPTLGRLFKAIFPILRSAAEKAFKRLPEEQRETLIAVSKLVEVVKQARGRSTGEVFQLIESHTGLDADVATGYIIQYLTDKGITVGDINPFVLVWQDAEQRTETGLKSLWIGMLNLISTTVAGIDWEALLLGIGEFVYRTYVKGRVNIK